ncbi:MAG TPA: PQQ-dependent sugar dehydrogenase, partial [Tepidisphaeraceae bacterium]|nr:PQQ-dependent sugar dehydrogenase [Tepidisphaeraceae bacterium]
MTGTMTALMGGTTSWAHADAKVERRVVEERVDSERGSFRVVQLVSGLEHPWAIAWLPDGRMLVTERPGRLNLIDDETISRLEGLPKIDSDENQKPAPQGGNQGGLLDVAVHPDFENNGWIYFTYSSPGDPDSITKDFDRATGTALSRARLNEDGTALSELQP